MTDALARAAGHDAASRSMRKAGRKRWSRADYNRAVRAYNRAIPARMAAALTRLAATFATGKVLIKDRNMKLARRRLQAHWDRRPLHRARIARLRHRLRTHGTRSA